MSLFARMFLTAIAVCVALATPLQAKPTLFLIGDSTVRNGTPGHTGWGDPLVTRFDPAKIDVVNRAIGGRSSRSFLTEGRWAAVAAHLKPGDFLLVQFGHNDGGPLNDGRARASLKGGGEETEDIVRQADGERETVHTYGWYLRRYAGDAKAKGALPIVVSPVPRNIWQNGKIARADRDYGLWAREAAEEAGVPFIDFNALLADAYDTLGPERTAALFCGDDHTHTSAEGADFNAGVMAAALRALPECALGSCLLPNNLWLPAVFSDHMVLQRDMPLPVWGSTKPGATVTATLGGSRASATANTKGDWQLTLPAMPAGGPLVLTVATVEATRAISDVLVGEVWLCSGQSNMDFTLAPTAQRPFAGVTDWQRETAAANHPRLRAFSAAWTLREAPQRDVPGRWMVCTPETAADFSAVAYYFGRALQERLDVPVGLLTCAYGASTIEAWISEPALRAHPQFNGLLANFRKKQLAFRDNPKLLEEYAAALARHRGAGRLPKHPDPVQDQHNPCVLHNGMIAPVAPYALRGAIWYQGESNVGTRSLYPDLQRTLIEEWRRLWQRPEMPFYFVQLAAHKPPPQAPGAASALAEMREAQAKALAIPDTGMAVAIDIGDQKDVHPRNKLDVGRRLARLALTGTYDQAGVATGPVFRDAVAEPGRIRVCFQPGCGPLRADGEPLRRFEIAGPDRKFVAAEAVIDGDTVVVASAAVPEPAFVRYSWADNPAGANLRNAEGLPAAPFRTDR